MDEEIVEMQSNENIDYTEVLNALLITNNNLVSVNEAILNRLEILVLLGVFCSALLVYRLIRRKRNV